MTVDAETTIKEIKKLNETFIFGELEANQYSIYKGGEQEDKYKKNREPRKYYYKYTEPFLLEDDSKILQDYDMHDNEKSYLKFN